MKHHFTRILFSLFAVATLANGQTTGSDTLPTPNRPVNPREIIKFQTRRTPNLTPPPAEVKGPIDKFFTSLKAGDTSKAYEELLLNTRLAQRKENLKVFIEKTDQAQGLYGKVLNYELYDNFNVGSSMMVLTYISMHPIQPLRWRLVYYKPEKGWMLIDVRVDDVLEDLID